MKFDSKLPPLPPEIFYRLSTSSRSGEEYSHSEYYEPRGGDEMAWCWRLSVGELFKVFRVSSTNNKKQWPLVVSENRQTRREIASAGKKCYGPLPCHHPSTSSPAAANSSSSRSRRPSFSQPPGTSSSPHLSSFLFSSSSFVPH